MPPRPPPSPLSLSLSLSPSLPLCLHPHLCRQCVAGSMSTGCESQLWTGMNEGRVAGRLVSFVVSTQDLGGGVTKFAPHKALKSIARGKLTFDEKGPTPPCGVNQHCRRRPPLLSVSLCLSPSLYVCNPTYSDCVWQGRYRQAVSLNSPLG